MSSDRCYSCMKEFDGSVTGVCPHCNYDMKKSAEKPWFITPGTVLEQRYVIGKAIGSGGFGITYTAWDIHLQRKVAIKEYYPTGIAERRTDTSTVTVKNTDVIDQYKYWLDSFKEEALRLVSMDSLNGIVHIYDSFGENNTAYIVMEYLEGSTLKEILNKNNQPIHYEEVVKMVLPALYSLDAVHRENIIHRDIAPDNIMRLPDGKIKIFDFGSAKKANVVSDDIAVLIKPGYSAVEQYDPNADQGPWTDVYSMAAVMYHLITGVRPAESVKRKKGEAEIVSPSQLGIEIPEGIENIIMYALNLDSKYRIRSAREFADEIIKQMQMIKKPTVPAQPEAPSVDAKNNKATKKLKLVLSVAAALSVLVVGVVFAVLTPDNSSIRYAYTVANLEGRSSDEVLSWAKQEKVTVKFVGTVRSSDENANGKVAWQEFEEGYKVRSDEADDFVLRVKTAVYDVNAEEYKSKMIEMPKLKDKTEQEAREILEEKGFYNYKFTEKQFSDKIKEGRVCEQSVEKGKSVRVDKEIYITLSKGSADKKSGKD